MWLGMFRLRSGMATLQSKALPLGMRDSKRLWRIGWLLASLMIFILTAIILLKGTLPSLHLKYDLSQLTSSKCWLWGHRIHENHYSIQWQSKLYLIFPLHISNLHIFTWHRNPRPVVEVASSALDTNAPLAIEASTWLTKSSGCTYLNHMERRWNDLNNCKEVMHPKRYISSNCLMSTCWYFEHD